MPRKLRFYHVKNSEHKKKRVTSDNATSSIHGAEASAQLEESQAHNVGSSVCELEGTEGGLLALQLYTCISLTLPSQSWSDRSPYILLSNVPSCWFQYNATQDYRHC